MQRVVNYVVIGEVEEMQIKPSGVLGIIFMVGWLPQP